MQQIEYFCFYDDHRTSTNNERIHNERNAG